MYKVIEVISSSFLPAEVNLKENEYPLISKYLEEGYQVHQVYPIIKSGSATSFFTIIFVLYK